MQALRQYIAEIADTDNRFRNRMAARRALADIESDALVELALLLPRGREVERYFRLLMGAYNAQP